MKLSHYCPVCSEVNSITKEDGSSYDSVTELLVIPLQDSPIYEVTCPLGHVSRIILQNQRYELLFQSGVNALLDGYYREAVSSIYVAVERFYEYSIRILSMPFLIEAEESSFSKTWSTMSKQTERQIGAFYMLFLCVYQRPPILFDTKFLKKHGLSLEIEGNDPINFRNRVIHQGYIPSYKQALIFGEAVNFYICELLLEYRKNTRLNVHAPIHEDVSAAIAAMGQLHVTTVMHTYTFVNHMRVGPDTKNSLIEYINSMRDHTNK